MNAHSSWSTPLQGFISQHFVALNFMNTAYLSLLFCILSISSSLANYVEVQFQGTVTKVDTGSRTIGDSFSGSFKYDIQSIYHSSGFFPTTAQYWAYPLPIQMDGTTTNSSKGSNLTLTELTSSSGAQSFYITSENYSSNLNGNISIGCELEGSSIFQSPFSAPVPPDFTNLTNSSFNYSLSVAGELNSYQDKFSGEIDTLTVVIHPEVPEVNILRSNSIVTTVQYYGKLQLSTDLKTWFDAPMLSSSLQPSSYEYPYAPTPERLFYKAVAE